MQRRFKFSPECHSGWLRFRCSTQIEGSKIQNTRLFNIQISIALVAIDTPPRHSFWFDKQKLLLKREDGLFKTISMRSFGRRELKLCTYPKIASEAGLFGVYKMLKSAAQQHICLMFAI